MGSGRLNLVAVRNGTQQIDTRQVDPRQWRTVWLGAGSQNQRIERLLSCDSGFKVAYFDEPRIPVDTSNLGFGMDVDVKARFETIRGSLSAVLPLTQSRLPRNTVNRNWQRIRSPLARTR